MKNSKITILLVITLLIATTISSVSGIKNNTNAEIKQTNILKLKVVSNYELKIGINPADSIKNTNIGDSYEIYEGQYLKVTLTGYWDPPNPSKTICLWADTSTMPTGATLTPPCNCAPGSVTSVFEWTPAIGQAGTYVVKFYLGETCEIPLGSFTITIIVYPAQNNPPVVTITSPADGTIVTSPHITVHGVVTDDTGIISIGSIHEWTGGEAATSGTVDPPSKYYPFTWDFDLYEDWNRITIFVSDGPNSAEDSLEIIYDPHGNQIPGVTFNQVDYYFDDESKIIKSYIGEIQVDQEELCSHFGIKTGYLNVMTPLGWVVQNMWLSSEYINEGIPYMATKFHLREGPLSGVSVNTLQAYIDFSTKPTPEFYGELFTTYPVGSISHYFEGYYFTPIIPTPVTFPCFPTLFCNQTNHSNVQAARNQCGPAACANSLHYLQAQYPDKINIPHDLIPGIGRTADQKPIPPNSTVSRVDVAMRRQNVANRITGNGVYAYQFIEGKLRYLNDTGLGQNINVKHQGQYVQRNYTIGNLTSRNRGKDGSKVTTEFIISEICKGEDVELLLVWPGRGAHWVDVTGAGLVCGRIKITHVSDQRQTHRDPSDTRGCDTVQTDWLEDDGNGTVRVVGGSSSPVGTIIEAVVSQSPNNPPNKPAKPTGPTRVKPGEENTYRTNPASDPDNDRIQRYEWDFDGDGVVDETTNEPSVSHSWPSQGDRQVRVRARDEYGAVSEWSDPLPVKVPKNKSYTNIPFLDLLQQYPLLYLIFQLLFKL